MEYAPQLEPVAIPWYSICFTLRKAYLPIIETPSGMVTEVNPVHSKKAESPIVVTLDGMVMEVRLLQLAKAHAPIEVTVDGIVTSVDVPIYADRVVLFSSVYIKSPSGTPFMVSAPQGAPVAVP